MGAELAAEAVALVRARYRRELTKTSGDGADLASPVLVVVELMVSDDPPAKGAVQSLRSNPDDDSAQRFLIDHLAKSAALYPHYRKALDDAVREATSTSGKGNETVTPRLKSRLSKILGPDTARHWTVIAGVIAVIGLILSLITYVIGPIEPSVQPTPSNPNGASLKDIGW